MCNLLEDLLDDDAVICADLAWRDFNMVVTLHDIHIKLAFCWSQEDPLVDLELEEKGGVEARDAEGDGERI